VRSCSHSIRNPRTLEPPSVTGELQCTPREDLHTTDSFTDVGPLGTVARGVMNLLLNGDPRWIVVTVTVSVRNEWREERKE